MPFELHSIENNLTCVILSGKELGNERFLSLKDFFLAL